MLESVHSESPMIHTRSGKSSDGDQLLSVERTRREAITAPFNSERGVDIRCIGVVRDLQLTSVV